MVRGWPCPAKGGPAPPPGPTAGSPTAGPSLEDQPSSGRQPDANLLCPQNHLKGLVSGVEGLRETGAAHVALCDLSPCVPRKQRPHCV